MDAAEVCLWCEDKLIALTPKQFDLLFYFVQNAGSLTRKDELLNAVWKDSFVVESTLGRNVSCLRKKLGECTNGEQIIETVPKVGYRFTLEVTHTAQDENVFIIEEQTVQKVQVEETFTYDEELSDFKAEIVRRWKYKLFIPK